METKIGELNQIDFIYEKKINMPNTKFGVEIEFAGAKFKEVQKELYKKFGCPKVEEYWPSCKKLSEKKYDIWDIVNEPTVQQQKNNEYIGGEINSPILQNKEKCWNELKQVCELLNKIEDIDINNQCSIHIHISKDMFTELKEILNLIKIWIIYEDIIYRIGYSEKDTPRQTLSKYAKPFGQEQNIMQIIGNLNTLETEEEIIKQFRYEKKYGLNLTNINKKTKQTLENRIFNGTLNEKIIQNDIRFTANLFEYCRKENFDEEFINYKLEKYEPIFLNESVKIKKEKVDEFSKLIIKDELDRIYLLKQYYKAYSDNDIEKTHYL